MWFYNKEPFTNLIPEFVSFVYLIERLNLEEDGTSPKYYIGKKIFIDKYGNESDWGTYYGSSDWIKENVDRFGSHNFKRTILHLCKTRGDSGYLEVKEQIDRNVLQKDKETGYKPYYNKSIFNRYYAEPETYEKIYPKDFKNMDYCDQTGKRRVTNGKKNKLLPPTKATTLVKTGLWWYGSSPKHIEANDGQDNFLVESLEEGQEIGWLKKWTTDGKNNKLLPTHQLAQYIIENPEWYLGFSGNKDTVWVTDGTHDLKMKKETWVKDYPTWELGRKVTNNTGKISIFKDEKYKFIYKEDLYKYPGWKLQGPTKGIKKYFVNHEGTKKYFLTELEQKDFLTKNIGWSIGSGKPNNFSLPSEKGMVPARDITKDMELVYVTQKEFQSNSNLIGKNSKRIRVTINGKTVFEGYRKEFHAKNKKVSKSTITESLKQNGKIIKSHDKNEYTAIFVDDNINQLPELKKVTKQDWDKIRRHYFETYPRRKILPKRPKYKDETLLKIIEDINKFLEKKAS